MVIGRPGTIIHIIAFIIRHCNLPSVNITHNGTNLNGAVGSNSGPIISNHNLQYNPTKKGQTPHGGGARCVELIFAPDLALVGN